jgi:hypothetical protein
MDIDEILAAQKAAKPIQEFFAGKIDPAAEIAAIDAEAESERPNPLDFKEISEEMCAEMAEAQNMADFWSERLKNLKDQAKRLAGRERGLLPYGAYALEIKESKGRTSTKWEKFVFDTQGAAGVDEAKAKYSETGEPVVSLSVKKLR